MTRALLAALFLMLMCCGGSSASKVSLQASLGSGTRGLTLPEGPVASFAALDKLPPLYAVPKCDTAAPPSRPSKARFIVQDTPATQTVLVALSGDGNVLAAVTTDFVLRAWDTRTGLLLRRVPIGMGAQNVSLSHDGGVVAYFAVDLETAGMKMHVIDLASDAAPRTMSAVAAGAKVTPDGKHIVVPLSSIDFYSTKTLRQVRQIPLPKGFIAGRLQFDAAGKRMAVAGNSGELLIVDVASGKVRSLGKPTSKPYSTAITWAGDRVIMLYVGTGAFSVNIDNGQATKLDGAARTLAALGKRVLYAPLTFDQKAPPLQSWDATTGAGAAVQLGDKRRVGSIASSRDGRTFAVAVNDWRGQRHGLVVYDARTMRAIRTLDGDSVGVQALSVSRDGKTLLTGGLLGQVHRWDLQTGAVARVTTSPESSPVRDLSFDESGQYFAEGVGTYYVRVRERDSGRVVRQWNAGNATLTMARFLPAGRRIITVALDGKVQIWTPGAKHPAPSAKKPMRFLDVGKPAVREVGTYPKGIRVAALSHDGALLALAVESGEVSLVELASGKTRWTAKGGTRSTASYMFRRWLAFGEGSLLEAGVDPAVGPERPIIVPHNLSNGKPRKTARVQTAGPMLRVGDTLLVGGSHPALLSASTLRRKAQLNVSDPRVISVAYNAATKLFFLGGDAGATTVVNAQGQTQAFVISTPDGEYVAATPDGAFQSSLDGARRIAWTFGAPLEAFTFEQFAEGYRKPEVVATRLQGGTGAKLSPPSRPPHVSFVGKRPPASVSADKLAIDVLARSSGRVERVRVYVNGRPAVDQLVCAPNKKLQLDVPLQAGKNRVSVVAYDAAGYASHPATADVISSAAKKKPDLWVVAFGVSQYPNLAPKYQLEYADDDARSIAAAFAKQAGPGGLYGKVHGTTLLDAEVTPAAVERAILSLSGMAPEDLAVVFMAGHGVKLDAKTMVYLTHGASLSKQGARQHGVGWHHIQAALSRARGRVVMLLDACHSGHVSTEAIALNDELASELAAGNRSGVFVFAASRGRQLSYEVGTGSGSRGLHLVDSAWEGTRGAPPAGRPLEGGHGLFTAALLDVLSGGGADRDRSGAVELGEMVDSVTELVRSASNGQQTPWVARRELFGDFAIAAMR